LSAPAQSDRSGLGRDGSSAGFFAPSASPEVDTPRKLLLGAPLQDLFGACHSDHSASPQLSALIPNGVAASRQGDADGHSVESDPLEDFQGETQALMNRMAVHHQHHLSLDHMDQVDQQEPFDIEDDMDGGVFIAQVTHAHLQEPFPSLAATTSSADAAAAAGGYLSHSSQSRGAASPSLSRAGPNGSIERSSGPSYVGGGADESMGEGQDPYVSAAAGSQQLSSPPKSVRVVWDCTLSATLGPLGDGPSHSAQGGPDSLLRPRSASRDPSATGPADRDDSNLSPSDSLFLSPNNPVDGLSPVFAHGSQFLQPGTNGSVAYPAMRHLSSAFPYRSLAVLGSDPPAPLPLPRRLSHPD
jgi:hypothetical protein